MHPWLLLTATLLSGCFGEFQKGDDDDDEDDDEEDLDTDDTGETGETGDSAETAEPLPVSLEVAASASSITTRETLDFVVTVAWDDGSETRETDAAYASDAEDVLKFYEADVGQPIGGGTAGWTVTWGDFPPATGSVDVTVVAATADDLVFNEVLADATLEGDPNGDGEVDDVHDEFVEIANLSGVTVDLSRVTFVESDFPDLPRHTFAAGTVLRAGEAVVLFGGGSVATLAADHVSFLVAENEDVGLQHGLSIRNDGESMSLLAADGTPITSLAFGDADTSGQNDAIEDASLVLTPDVVGTTWTHHSYAAGSAGDMSPGAFVDGSAFLGPDGIYGR